MDGLDAVQPYGDADLRSLRSSLSLGPTTVNNVSTVLNDFYSLHPSLMSLMPLWQDGSLAVVHATSTPYRNKRSHFDGQDILELGSNNPSSPDYELGSGWMNRLVSAIPNERPDLAAASSEYAPLIARGSNPFIIWSPSIKFALADADKSLIDGLYDKDQPLKDAWQAAQLIATSDLPSARTNADMLVKHLNKGGGIGYMSINGWDTHANQEVGIDNRFKDLAAAIMTFRNGMAQEVWDKTVIVTVTEFGRTARQNGSGGTDHGTASCMFIAGGAVKGGAVYGEWPGLSENQTLQQPRPVADI